MTSTEFHIEKAGLPPAIYNEVSPGKTVNLQAQLMDKKGCETRGRIRWKTERGTIDRNGVLRTDDIEVGARFVVRARHKRIERLFPIEIGSFSSSISPSIPVFKLATPPAVTVLPNSEESEVASAMNPVRVVSIVLLLLGAGLLIFRRWRFTRTESVG